MGVTEQIEEPADFKGLSDKELIERFCANRKDQALAAELWRRYGKTIHEALKPLAFGRNGLCPDSCDRKTFLDSSFSRTYINLLARICGFRNLDSPSSMKAWLGAVARTAALDERKAITRSRSKIREIGLETAQGTFGDASASEHGEGIAEQIEAALFRSGFYRGEGSIPPPDVRVIAEERKFIVRELLVRHAETSEEDAASARAIRLWCWRDWNMTKIAAYFFGEPVTEREKNTRLKAVSRDMHSDFEKLRTLLVTQFGIRSLREV